MQFPCWNLLGPWQPMGDGEVRDMRGPFPSQELAQSAQRDEWTNSEVVEGKSEKMSIWRNYSDGTQAEEIFVMPEIDASENGYALKWVSPSWVKAEAQGG